MRSAVSPRREWTAAHHPLVKQCEMDAMNGRRALIHGFGWGALAGLVLVALMYLASLLLDLKPLTQALNEPLLSIMPGFVFGFLIDQLQHAGKVVEEFGLIVAVIVALGVLGAAWAWTALRWHFQYSALVFAAAGWLVVVVLLLPIAGDGPFGLTSGPTTPLVWAALFAVYGVVLQLGGRPDTAAADPDRRRLLSVLPLSLGALSLGVLAFKLAPNWYQAIFNPPEAGLYGRSPQLTPIQNFYVVSKNFGDPNVDGGSWRLKIGGMAGNPVSLTLQDLRALPVTSEYVTLECISNNVGGNLMSTGGFTGVSLKYLLEQVKPTSSATWAAFKAAHGYPARILIPGRYGMKGPKWLTEIELVDHESGGYWEQQGWDHNAVVKTTSRFDVPRDGDIVKVSGVTISGVAYAGTRGIGKVEVTTDGGASWTEALRTAPLSQLTWVLWNFDWTPPKEGSYHLAVRATDGSGAVQESNDASSYPGGAMGYHAIRVDVSK